MQIVSQIVTKSVGLMKARYVRLRDYAMTENTINDVATSNHKLGKYAVTHEGMIFMTSRLCDSGKCNE